MKKYSLSLLNMSDPYAFLAELVLYQAFYDIECYYYKKGNPVDRQSGYFAEKWIRRMDKYFQIYASATQHPIEEIHQWCLAEINRIKEEARVRQVMATENQPSPVGGEPDTTVV